MSEANRRMEMAAQLAARRVSEPPRPDSQESATTDIDMDLPDDGEELEMVEVHRQIMREASIAEREGEEIKRLRDLVDRLSHITEPNEQFGIVLGVEEQLRAIADELSSSPSAEQYEKIVKGLRADLAAREAQLRSLQGVQSAQNRIADERVRASAPRPEDTPETTSEPTPVAWAVLAEDGTAIDLGWTDGHMEVCIKRRADLSIAGAPYRIAPLYVHPASLLSATPSAHSTEKE